MFQTRLPLYANQHLCFNAYAILKLVGYGSKRFLFSPSFLLLRVSLKHLPNNLSGAIIIIGMQATSEVAYFFPIVLSFFPPFLFPLLPFCPFLSSLFLMFRWWGASELNHMQGTREKWGETGSRARKHVSSPFSPWSPLFFSPRQFFNCALPSECLELATSYPTSTSKDFVSIAKTLLYMHIKVQQTRSYPNLVISGQHTCRAMGSNVKSQESPTESSRASSIAFNWEAYSSKNCPYFLNCASPTISINV